MMMKNLLLVVTVALLLCSAVTVVDASAYPVTDASQAKCYDQNGSIISCKGTGQDGQYKKLPQKFCNHGDNTVTDMVRKYEEGFGEEYSEWKLPLLILAYIF